MVTTTSPVAPGNRTLPGAGVATAVMDRLAMVADCPSPDEPAFRPTTQLVPASAPAPTRTQPPTAETIFARRDHRLAFFVIASTVLSLISLRSEAGPLFRDPTGI